jgi:hypothetical protein
MTRPVALAGAAALLFAMAATLASGDADLSDPNYFFRSLRASHSGALGYEKRMLDDWVASLVAAKR